MADYQFNVGKKTIESYRKERKNTMAKIRNIKKRYGIDLSSEIELPSLESFGSRKEFNEWSRNVQDFRKRSNYQYQYVKNDYGVVASKKQLFEIEQKTKKAQRIAEKKLKEAKALPFYSGGKEQGTVGMQRPNKSGVTVPKKFDFKQVRSQGRLKDVEESLEKKSKSDYYEQRNKIMMDNFIDVLGKSYNSQAEQLIDEIKQMNPDDFYELYLMFDEFDFMLFYENSGVVGAEFDDTNVMLGYLKAFNDGEINMNLKHKNFK